MIVAGVMSGTSADGINVALVRIQGRGFRSRLELLAHYEFPYPSEVRHAVLQVMNDASARVADLARLNFTLGSLYANAVRAAQRRARLECELVGCHGQTIYHQGAPNQYLGRSVACTWQTGESAVIAAVIGRTGSLGLPSCRHGSRRQRRTASSLPRLRHYSAIAGTDASCKTSAASVT